MAKLSRTGAKVASYREVLGSYDALRSFTHITPQRLNAIAGGAKPTASERGSIAAFTRRMSEGHVSQALLDASRRQGLSLGTIGQQLQGIAQGTYTGTLSIDQIGKKLGVESSWVYHVSQEAMKKPGWNGGEKEPRGIEYGIQTADGRIIGYGRDGHTYVAYVVTNKQTGEKRFFWARQEAVSGLVMLSFEDMYSDESLDFDVDLGF